MRGEVSALLWEIPEVINSLGCEWVYSSARNFYHFVWINYYCRRPFLMRVVGLFLVSSFNGGIDQGLDRLRAGKPINIVGMLSFCFKFCDF